MKGFLYGRLDAPAVALIGTWDPLIRGQEQIFKDLSYYASSVSLTSLVIMLHPPPPSFLPNNPLEWPIYDDPKTRVALIDACGIDGILLLHFERRDLDLPAKDFFNVVLSHVTLYELFLGAHQTLGRGPEASNEVVAKLAKELSIRLERLPPFTEGYLGRRARDLLRRGLLRESILIVGRPPIWRRPPRGELRLAWPPGEYLSSPVDSPTALPNVLPTRTQLVAEEDGFSTVKWPDYQSEWLAFIAGPADPVII
jgi:FAD synthase